MTGWDRFTLVMFGLHYVMFTLHIVRECERLRVTRARRILRRLDSDTGGPP